MALVVLSSARVHRLLIALALFVPTVSFVGAAWESRVEVMREGEDTILHSLAVMSDHAQTVFQAEERALISVDDHIRGLSWEDLAKPETATFLRNLTSSFAQVESIWIADREGVIRAGSQNWQPGTRIADQEFFQAERRHDVGTYLSTTLAGSPPQIAALTMIRRRSTPDGEFDGTIDVELTPEYFTHYFAEAAPAPHDVLLVRADGEILARDPDRTGHLGSATQLMQRIGARSPGSIFADRDRRYSYQQVPGYPVYISLGIRNSALLARWYNGLLIYGITTVFGSAALLLVSWLAIRSARAEQTALKLAQAETEKRLEIEQRLHHAEHLEAIGRITGGVAHDFNNLLAIIVSSLELIGPAKDTEKTQQLIARALRAAERGARLTSSLLAFGRQQMLQPEIVDANALLREVLPIIKAAVGDAVEVRTVLDPTLRPCRADRVQLEMALLNLAINARDAMPSHGTLTLGTINTEQSACDLVDNPEAVAGPFTAISILDSGSGMDDDVKAKAFEPFFSTKEVGSGSGLGLSQVLGSVRQVGGHVTIDSELGHGTMVTLFLPEAATGSQ